MGAVELDNQRLFIYSHLITYGNSADPAITEYMRQEIESLWNEPGSNISIKNTSYPVIFRITASFEPAIQAIEIYQNLNPRNNYFRIEEFAYGNISFVDGLGSNSGYFIISNLYRGSTTAAHEYGHTIGLSHPENLDIRGEGVPGIMYPRGTLVDPPYQYEPERPAGTKGGTMHPMFRRVRAADIASLQLQKLRFENNHAILGDFSSVWHDEQRPI